MDLHIWVKDSNTTVRSIALWLTLISRYSCTLFSRDVTLISRYWCTLFSRDVTLISRYWCTLFSRDVTLISQYSCTLMWCTQAVSTVTFQLLHCSLTCKQCALTTVISTCKSVKQSHPLRRTCFDQYQPSWVVLGLGDGDYYLIQQRHMYSMSAANEACMILAEVHPAQWMTP